MEKLLVTVVKNKASRMSLVAGLLSIIPPLLFFPGIIYPHMLYVNYLQIYLLLLLPLGLIAAVTAISTGIVSLWQIKKPGAAGKGSAIAGLVLGILAATSVFLVVSLLLAKLS